MRDVAISLGLVGVAIAVSARLSLRLERELLVSAARGLVQLLIVTAAITAVLESVGLSGLFLAVMLTAAAWTSGRRLAGVPRSYLVAGTSIAAGALTALAVLFGLDVFDFEPRFLIPIAGMLIGNCMTATSLAGTRLRDDVVARLADVEVRLALGVRATDALAPHRRRAVTGALIPTIDSTKNVGLIFLPGAFVGMVLAGQSPAAAARIQLVVLFMLLGAVSVAGMVATLLVARAFVAPGDRIVVFERD